MQSGNGRRQIRKCYRNINCLPGTFLPLLNQLNSQIFTIFHKEFLFFSFYDFNFFFGTKLTFFLWKFIHNSWEGGTVFFCMINLPNSALIFCRIFVVAGSFAVAVNLQQVERCCCSLNGLAVAGKHCYWPVRCSYSFVVRLVPDGFLDDLLVVDIDFVGVGSGRVQLEGRECVVLRLRFQRRLFFGVQLVC